MNGIPEYRDTVCSFFEKKLIPADITGKTTSYSAWQKVCMKELQNCFFTSSSPSFRVIETYISKNRPGFIWEDSFPSRCAAAAAADSIMTGKTKKYSEADFSAEILSSIAVCETAGISRRISEMLIMKRKPNSPENHLYNAWLFISASEFDSLRLASLSGLVRPAEDKTEKETVSAWKIFSDMEYCLPYSALKRDYPVLKKMLSGKTGVSSVYGDLCRKLEEDIRGTLCSGKRLDALEKKYFSAVSNLFTKSLEEQKIQKHKNTADAERSLYDKNRI